MATALVIGYGSIGSRHVRILKQLGCKVAVCSRRQTDGETVYHDVSEAVRAERPDYVVVANSTDEHYTALLKLISADYSGKVLMEKPLFKQTEEAPEYDARHIFVAYNLRLHPVVLEMKAMLDTRSAFSCHVYHGQYLPNWRPNTDYRKSYSADKQLGGGVIRDLSHELDYACWLFDGWTSLAAHGGHYSHLAINSDDVYNISLITRKCPSVHIHLNYLDRIPQRKIIVNCRHETIIGDLIHNTLLVNDALHRFQTDKDETYVKQHIKILTGDTKPLCTFTEGMDIVRLIEAAEQSSVTKQWVDNRASI